MINTCETWGGLRRVQLLSPAADADAKVSS